MNPGLVFFDEKTTLWYDFIINEKEAMWRLETIRQSDTETKGKDKGLLGTKAKRVVSIMTGVDEYLTGDRLWDYLIKCVNLFF